ncbi:NUDIX hydrolase domain-like protein [Roridomyces roridus]|uniref:NAD(+) diphosphatase n=1 Tax=Roridomyces roridus TaxID=1738132 RepID=A0AAD7FX86_9AGAR|nr:NUDIX hydrolase domain-like protein [Roridomyces roridus]
MSDTTSAPLNRLSWLRTSHSFLNAIAASPNARWLLLNGTQHLLSSSAVLAELTTEQVKSFLGPEPWFGQGKDEGQTLTANELGTFTESARHRGPRIVFLGLHDALSTVNALPTSDFTDPETAVAKLNGTPYFAFDIGEANASAFLEEHKQFSWGEARPLMMNVTLDKLSLALFTESRSMVDWNLRNKFCPACGSPTFSQWGGWKLSCSTLLPWADNTGKEPCPTAKGLHNFAHPRTDPVVITLVLDETGEKVLMGRGKKFPGKFYSALAGFIEPAETFEDSVIREIWEEAGVKVWDVQYHSTQPWPFPANLMVGFYARADSSQTIRVDLDNELADARWFTRAEVLEVVNHKLGSNLSGRDHKRLDEITDGPSGKAAAGEAAPVVEDEPPFRVPPTGAIAGVLIRDWAFGKKTFAPIQKGNL